LRRIVTVFRKDCIQLLQRLGKAVLLIQYIGKICARRAKIRGKFERPSQQRLTIFQPANSGGKFGHQAYRRDISGCTAQMRPQQGLCIFQPVF